MSKNAMAGTVALAEEKKRSPVVLWYPGKTLYESAKGAVGVESEYEEENAPDYDNDAAQLAARKPRPTAAQQMAGKSKQKAVAGTGKVAGELAIWAAACCCCST